MTTFDEWLRAQVDRDDSTGDLARDYIADCRCRGVESMTGIRAALQHPRVRSGMGPRRACAQCCAVRVARGDVMTAREDLADALLELVLADRTTPCAGDGRWTSDDLEELQAAAVECQRCPIRAECLAVGRREKWGCWGGRVIGGSKRPGRPRQEAAS